MIGTLAAIAFVVYRLHAAGFAWHEFIAVLYRVKWSWLALAQALTLATYVGRALRWEVMLRPLRKNASLWRIFVSTAIGFTAVVLFGRAGEPVRPYLIAKDQNVTFSTQVAAWVVERILDLLMVLVIFGVALTQIGQSAIQPGPRIRVIAETGGFIAGAIGVASLALLIGLRQFRGRVQSRLLEGLAFLPGLWQQRIADFMRAFDEGMEATRSPGYAIRLSFYTVVEWIVIVAAFMCVLKAFPSTDGLGLTDAVILVGFVAFGSVVQLPGVGGGMQIATVLVLTELFGVTFEAASGIALVLWILTFVMIVPIGLVLAFHEGIRWRSLTHLETQAAVGLGDARGLPGPHSGVGTEK